MKAPLNNLPMLPPDLLSEFVNQQIAYAVASYEISKESLLQSSQSLNALDLPVRPSPVSVAVRKPH